MTKAMVKYRVSRFNQFGFRYNVQRLVKSDKKGPFMYPGQGRFCRNLREVFSYIMGK